MKILLKPVTVQFFEIILSNLLVHTVSFVIFTLYRLSYTQALQISLTPEDKLNQLARCRFHAF